MSYSDIIYTISDNSLDVFKTKQEAINFIQLAIVVVRVQNKKDMLLF